MVTGMAVSAVLAFLRTFTQMRDIVEMALHIVADDRQCYETRRCHDIKRYAAGTEYG